MKDNGKDFGWQSWCFPDVLAEGLLRSSCVVCGMRLENLSQCELCNKPQGVLCWREWCSVLATWPLARVQSLVCHLM